MTRDDILEQLAALLPAQFETVLFRVGILPEYLSSPNSPQLSRAIEVIRYLEQQGRLNQVEASLAQVSAPSARRPGAKVAPTPPTEATPVRCFISHAVKDERLFDELRTHFKPLVQEGTLMIFDVSEVRAGEIRQDWVAQVEDADLILPLISADYLDSDYLWNLTLRATERHREGTARVVPIIIRACDWRSAPFGALQALPRDGRPITVRTDRDAAWVDVVQGLRLVIKDLRDAQVVTPVPAPNEAATADLVVRGALAPLRSVARRPISEIFKTSGSPTDTFVEPDRFRRLRIALATMSKGLVVEGPSGVGKSVAVKKALAELRQTPTMLSGINPSEVARLKALLSEKIQGHVVVDDFHRLEASLKVRLANLIKYLADGDEGDGKITLLGVNQAGRTLTAELPDLAGRVDIFSMGRQPDAKIAQLITQGERAANVRFVRRSEFVIAALGSFYTAQQLCLSAAEQAGVEETMGTLMPIEAAPRDVIPDMMRELDRKYAGPLLGFVGLDRRACFSLLWLLSRAQEACVVVGEARYGLHLPQLDAAFDRLVQGALARGIDGVPKLSELLFYDESAQLLSIEDPRLEFYLRNLSFDELGRRAGLSVKVSPEGRLIF